MIAVTDVHYRSQTANAALVIARDWADAWAATERAVTIPVPDEYEPGAFYRRELPAVLAVLEGSAPLDVVIVDGYVWLGAEHPGLGAYLWRALGQATPVVGIAKNRFGEAPAVEVVRGESSRPLYVTAAGMDDQEAAARVASMHGRHRVPTLVLRADHLARGLP